MLFVNQGFIESFGILIWEKHFFKYTSIYF